MTLKEIKKSFVSQNSESGCGPACLSSILKFYGKDINQEQVGILSGTNKNGTTLLGLYQAAKSLGFDAEGYETDIEQLKKIKSPCILPVIINKSYEHYIVFYKYDGLNFIIGNPSTGINKMSEQELLEVWECLSLLLITPTDSAQKEKHSKKNKINWFLITLKADYPFLIISTLIGIVVSILSISVTYFSQKLIDNFLPQHKNSQIIMGFIFLLLKSS